MTQALYLNDVKTAKVDVLSCQISKDGLFEVRLSETPFHPQGGDNRVILAQFITSKSCM